MPPAPLDPGSQASVTIQIPEGGTLSVQGKTVAMESNSKTFQTPTLDRAQTYAYEMKVSVNKDGKEFMASKRVLIRAGETVTVDLRDVRYVASKEQIAQQTKPEPVRSGTVRSGPKPEQAAKR
jgi:uncharacterized protein (TIGR03000 family)